MRRKVADGKWGGGGEREREGDAYSAETVLQLCPKFAPLSCVVQVSPGSEEREKERYGVGEGGGKTERKRLERGGESGEGGGEREGEGEGGNRGRVERDWGRG